MSDNRLLSSYTFFPYQDFSVADLDEVCDWITCTAEKTKTVMEDESLPLSWDNTLGKHVEFCYAMLKAVGPAYHMDAVDHKEEFVRPMKILNETYISAFTPIYQSSKLYKRLQQLKKEAWEDLDLAERRVLDSMLLDQKHTGVGCDKKTKKELLDLATEMSNLSLQFKTNVMNHIKEYSYIIHDKDELSGVPELGLAMLSQAYEKKTSKPSTAEKGPWLVGIDSNSIEQIQRFCHNRELRKKIYFAAASLASKGEHNNEDIVGRILALREKEAKILGYKHFADLVMTKKMVPSVEAVADLHESIIAACSDIYTSELADQQAMLQQVYGEGETLEDWDKAYLMNKLRKQKYDFDPIEVREYFPFDQVLSGLFSLVRKLFSVEFRDITSEIVGVDKSCLWDEHVSVYVVADENNGEVKGHLFLDPYARPGSKNGGAWHNGLPRRYLSPDGVLHTPKGYVVCNFMPPTKETPSLLSLRDVETLFHEFGHMLQHVLSTVDNPLVSGTALLEWDAVELPSQFMEYWFYKKDVFMNMGKHYKTSEPISEELYNKVVGSRNYGKGAYYLTQASHGMIDMELHTRKAEGLDMFSCYRDILAKTTGEPRNEEALNFCLRFSHIFAGGYAAGYYGYLYSRVLSADAFSLFEKEEAKDKADLQTDAKHTKALGKSFRDTILALGGSKHPLDVYAKFSGSKAFPSTDALLRYDVMISQG